jgi:hypothetical protein
MSGYSTTGSNAFFGGIHEPRGSLLLGVTDRGRPRTRHSFFEGPLTVPEKTTGLEYKTSTSTGVVVSESPQAITTHRTRFQNSTGVYY